MSESRATAARSKLRSLPGVTSVSYDAQSHELLVTVAGTATVKQRQRIIIVIARAAND